MEIRSITFGSASFFGDGCNEFTASKICQWIAQRLEGGRPEYKPGHVYTIELRMTEFRTPDGSMPDIEPGVHTPS
jgi:hypothetical protein